MLDGTPIDPHNVVAYCRSTRYDFFSFMPLSPPLNKPPVQSPSFNRRVYNAIIMYRFRSWLLVLSMYRGNRSRINRTGNEFSVWRNVGNNRLAGHKWLGPTDLRSGMRITYASLSILFTLFQSFARFVALSVMLSIQNAIKSLIIDFNPKSYLMKRKQIIFKKKKKIKSNDQRISNW